MKEINFKLEIQMENETLKLEGFTEYDETKWKEIDAICKYRKASVFNLLEDYLNTLTPEKAEEILISWDM